MTPAAFNLTIAAAMPPGELTPPLAALWWAKKSEWDKAHRIVMEASGPEAAWVHAYLHRVEGDTGNAGYWYRQAGQPVAIGDLDAEWAVLVEALLRTGAKRTR